MTLGNRLWQGVAVMAAGMLVAGSAIAQVNHNPTTEPRTGPNHLLVFTFNKPVVSGVATVSEGVATVGAVTVDPSNANSLLVPLTGVTDIQYVTVDMSAVVAVDGGTGGVGSTRVGFLYGDVNGTRIVAVSDKGLVNAQLGQSVTASNYLLDVNANGLLAVSDKGIVNVQLGHALPIP